MVDEKLSLQGRVWYFLNQKVFIGQGKLWFLFLLFCAISAIVGYSANSQEIYKAASHGGSSFLPSHFLFLMGGILVAFVFSQIPVIWFTKKVWFQRIFFGLILILIAGLYLAPVRINQAVRWTNILGVSLQPSEFVKLGIIFLGAYWARFKLRRERKRKKNPSSVKNLSPIVIFIWLIIAGFSLFLLCRHNLSLLILLIIFVYIYLLIIGMPRRTAIIWAMIGGFVGLALLFSLYYYDREKLIEMYGERGGLWKTRVMQKISPSSDEMKFELTDENRQEKYALIAMSRGKVFGVGPGNSKMRDLLPMAASDFVYAIIVEEYGLLGLLFIPLLYIWFFILSYRIVQKEKDITLRTLAIGIGVYYPLQALLNIAVASGMFMTGQQMPFISVGGSGLLVASMAMGILMSISRTQYLTQLYLQEVEAEETSSSALIVESDYETQPADSL